MSRMIVTAFTLALSIGQSFTEATAEAARMATLPGGTFEPLFKSGLPGQAVSVATVKAFQLDVVPVTSEDFAHFTRTNPKWRRDQINSIFADQRYLSHWPTETGPGIDQLSSPVVNVSWHAAKAYCIWAGSRLPTDLEWQFAAYEGSPDYAERLASWYSKPSVVSLPRVGSSEPNRFQIFDMYGPIWEWVGDFSSLMVADDGRAGSGTDAAKFCGAGALSATETRNYIGFMRAAYLSALKADYTTSSLGFRCARDTKGDAT